MTSESPWFCSAGKLQSTVLCQFPGPSDYIGYWELLGPHSWSGPPQSSWTDKMCLAGNFLGAEHFVKLQPQWFCNKKMPCSVKTNKNQGKKKTHHQTTTNKTTHPPKKKPNNQTNTKETKPKTKNPTNNTTPKNKPKQQTHHSKCWKALDLALYIMGFQANPDPIAKGCLLREASAQTAVSICLTTSHMEGNCAYNVKSEYTFIISGSGLLSWVLDNLHEKLMYLICEASSVFWLLWKQLWSHFSILQFD